MRSFSPVAPLALSVFLLGGTACGHQGHGSGLHFGGSHESSGFAGGSHGGGSSHSGWHGESGNFGSHGERPSTASHGESSHPHLHGDDWHRAHRHWHEGASGGDYGGDDDTGIVWVGNDDPPDDDVETSPCAPCAAPVQGYAMCPNGRCILGCLHGYELQEGHCVEEVVVPARSTLGSPDPSSEPAPASPPPPPPPPPSAR